MNGEKEGYYGIAQAQEKNQEDLDSYKELLKKELDSIRSLVGTGSAESNGTSESHLASNSVVSKEDYEKLIEENRTLKSENDALNSANSMLERDNKLLRENIEALKVEYSKFTELEDEISRLKEVILNLEKEKLELKAREAPKISVNKKLYDQDLPIDISNEIKSIFKDEKVDETNTPIVHKGYTVPPIKPKRFKIKLFSQPESITNDTAEIDLSDVSTPSEDQNSEKINEETVRRKCPTCFNTNIKYIREFPDKSNIIMHYPRIYGKKFKCGICTTEWK